MRLAVVQIVRIFEHIFLERKGLVVWEIEPFQQLGKKLSTGDVNVIFERFEYSEDLFGSDFVQYSDPRKPLFYFDHILAQFDAFQGPLDFGQQGASLETVWIFVEVQ